MALVVAGARIYIYTVKRIAVRGTLQQPKATAPTAYSCRDHISLESICIYILSRASVSVCTSMIVHDNLMARGASRGTGRNGCPPGIPLGGTI